MAEVSDAGMRSFEHFFGLTSATSVHEDQFMRRIRAVPVDPANPRSHYDKIRVIEMEASLSHSRSKAAALFDRLARNNSWQTPTLHLQRVMSLPAETYLDDPRLKYIDRTTKDGWRERIKIVAPVTPAQIVRHRQYREFRYDLILAMAQAGVRILGGTDFPNPYTFPGFSTHDELEVLVEAGFTPMRALQTMTSEAACHLGRQRTHGTVAAGKVADLVVLDADPLADIRNTKKINAVLLRGKLITAQERTKIFADVEKAAAELPPPSQPQGSCAC